MSDDLATAIAGAWAYEELHVNARFQQLTGPLIDVVQVAADDRVLDVACGTGM